eukprot:SAG11_NODE_8287_length_1034_cov_0.875936_3_plen_79_part_01
MNRRMFWWRHVSQEKLDEMFCPEELDLIDRSVRARERGHVSLWQTRWRSGDTRVCLARLMPGAHRELHHVRAVPERPGP